MKEAIKNVKTISFWRKSERYIFGDNEKYNHGAGFITNTIKGKVVAKIEVKHHYCVGCFIFGLTNHGFVVFILVVVYTVSLISPITYLH